MTVNNALDIGETDAVAFELGSAVKALENTKEFIRIFHIKTCSVIPDKNNGLILLTGGKADFYYSPLER